MPFKDGGELAPRPRPGRHGLCDDLGRSGQGLRVELELAVATGVAGVEPRPTETQEPAKILWRHVVPGRPQDVGAKDAALVEGTVEHRAAGGGPGALGH
jgi:hypothetical protein